MYTGLHVKYRFLSDLNETRILTDFSKNTQISNLMKIRPVGAELFHGDGETDMAKLIIACRNFANCPLHAKNGHHSHEFRKASCVRVLKSLTVTICQPELRTLISLHVKTKIRRATACEQTDGCASRVASRTRHV